MSHFGRVWDQELCSALLVDEVPDGLILTLDTPDDGESITLSPERVRELRLLLQRYERENRR